MIGTNFPLFNLLRQKPITVFLNDFFSLLSLFIFLFLYAANSRRRRNLILRNFYGINNKQKFQKKTTQQDFIDFYFWNLRSPLGGDGVLCWSDIIIPVKFWRKISSPQHVRRLHIKLQPNPTVRLSIMTVAVKLNGCAFYIRIQIRLFFYCPDHIIPSLFKMICP